jgi:hypothetical protein
LGICYLYIYNKNYKYIENIIKGGHSMSEPQKILFDKGALFNIASDVG